jgi:hypothetical protein
MRRQALPFLIGILSGALGGLMGVGGGIVLVPLLVHLMSLEQHEAQGTSFAFIIATALVAAVPYFRLEHIDLGLAACLSAGAVPGVILGARIAGATPARRLGRWFGFLMLATAIRLLAAPPGSTPGGAAWPWPADVVLGLVVGVLAGLLGVGGGTILVPVLVLGQRIEQHVAQGVSLLMIVPVGVIGMLSYARQGRIVVALLPALVAGGALGALAGALLAHETRAPVLSRLFAVFLLPVAARMIFGKPRGSVAATVGPSGGAP